MVRSDWALAVALVCCGCAGTAAGCSGDTFTVAGDGGQVDALPDGPTADGVGLGESGTSDGFTACGPGQVRCKSACLSATDCTQCPGAPYLCALGRRECVALCSVGCDSNSRPCIECVNGDAGAGVGTCTLLEADGGLLCPFSLDLHCSCNTGGVSTCPADNQVCLPQTAASDRCLTCGESGSASLVCKFGGTCQADGVCR